jgi:hypothetical protein
LGERDAESRPGEFRTDRRVARVKAMALLITWARIDLLHHLDLIAGQAVRSTRSFALDGHRLEVAVARVANEAVTNDAVIGVAGFDHGVVERPDLVCGENRRAVRSSVDPDVPAHEELVS